MYRVLIVDDEKYGREGIKFLLNDLKEEFQITMAENGKIAYQYLKENQIDFLLTDIKMPFMDGIELIEKVMVIQPEIKVIIFSGYSDFDYAKKAISNGVSEYILKPVDPQEFYNSMNKIIGEFELLQSEKEKLSQNQNILKQYILHSLINGKNINFFERNNDIDLSDLDLNYQRLLLIDFNNSFFDLYDDIEKKLHNLTNIDFDYINLSTTQSLLFIKEENIENLKAFASSIIKFINLDYQRRAYIAISDILGGCDDWVKRVDDLENRIEARYFNNDNQLFLSNEGLKQTPLELIENLVDNTNQAIKIKDINQIKENIKEFYNLYNDNNGYSNEYLKFMFSGVIRNLINLLDVKDNREIEKDIIQFYHSKDYRGLSAILDKFINLVEKELKDSSSMIDKKIDSIIKYIYSHYNEDLSVDSLADYVCLAPSYLSHIFKKETNQNLGKFIKMVRMEKAIDMLEHSHEKIVTIAVAVGYQNVSYFCQCFREYYGVSPQKYRSNGE